MNWACWFAHAWSKWKTSESLVMKYHKTGHVSPVQERTCERCGKTETRELDT